MHYERADCCILVYDITNLKSFEVCKNFYKREISKTCKKGIKVILVGNKVDLENTRKVSKDKGAKFANENDYYFKETSCDNNLNVADAFETIIIMTNNDMIKSGKQNLEEKIDINTLKIDENNNDIQEVDNNDNLNSEKKCCCCII